MPSAFHHEICDNGSSLAQDQSISRLFLPGRLLLVHLLDSEHLRLAGVFGVCESREDSNGREQALETWLEGFGHAGGPGLYKSANVTHRGDTCKQTQFSQARTVKAVISDLHQMKHLSRGLWSPTRRQQLPFLSCKTRLLPTANVTAHTWGGRRGNSI